MSENYRLRQMARIIRLLFLINKQPNRTRRELAEHFNVNIATIQRDINLCREMGIEIKVDGKQGYYIESGFTELLEEE